MICIAGNWTRIYLQLCCWPWVTASLHSGHVHTFGFQHQDILQCSQRYYSNVNTGWCICSVLARERDLHPLT